jgi:Rrf2 family iron-sulfur cluster assembly transcriptional regulator
VYSPTCQYALRALIHITRQGGGGPVLARDIAAAENIPRQFLSKILHDLRLKGLVQSQRGPGGGFYLARPAKDILVSDVVVAVDGVQNLAQRCILGLDTCTDEEPCALHDAWKLFRERYERTIAASSLQEMASTLARKRRVRPAIVKTS